MITLPDGAQPISINLFRRPTRRRDWPDLAKQTFASKIDGRFSSF
jgi:hypothetical protein